MKYLQFAIIGFAITLSAVQALAQSKLVASVDQENQRVLNYLNTKSFLFDEDDPINPCLRLNGTQIANEIAAMRAFESADLREIKIECVESEDLNPDHMGECTDGTISFRRSICDYILPKDFFPEYRSGRPGKFSISIEDFERWKDWLFNTHFSAPVIGVLACHALHEATHATQPPEWRSCIQEYWAFHEQLLCLNRHREDCIMSGESSGQDNGCRSIDQAIESKTTAQEYNACVCGWGGAISPEGSLRRCAECMNLCVESNPSDPDRRERCEGLRRTYCF